MQKSSSNIVPRKLLFEIGGYASPSFKLELEKNRLKYSDGHSFGFWEEDFFEPSSQEWKQLRKALEKIRVWDWSRQYESDVLDGTQWSFEVFYEDNSIKIDGNNAYPNPEKLSESVVLEFTEPFINLLSALRNVTSNNCFKLFQ